MLENVVGNDQADHYLLYFKLINYGKNTPFKFNFPDNNHRLKYYNLQMILYKLNK